MKKILNLTGKLAVLMLMLSLTGCYYDEVIEIAPLPPGTEVSFADDIQPIFNQNCIACHGGSIEPDLREGSAFASLMGLPEGSIVPGDADGSELVEMLNGGGDNPMPPSGPIPAAQINLIKSWIDNGALNN